MKWWLVAIVLMLAVAVSVVAYALGEGLASAVRISATFSSLVFVAVFVARPLNVIRPSDASKWLLRNRRYLGVGFAVAHLWHGGLVIALLVLAPRAGEGLGPSAIAGTATYLLLVAMLVTSFDRSAGWLSRSTWERLHRTGMWALYLFFTLAFVKRAAQPRYWPQLILFVALLALRVLAWQRARRATTVRA